MPCGTGEECAARSPLASFPPGDWVSAGDAAAKWRPRPSDCQGNWPDRRRDGWQSSTLCTPSGINVTPAHSSAALTAVRNRDSATWASNHAVTASLQRGFSDSKRTCVLTRVTRTMPARPACDRGGCLVQPSDLPGKATQFRAAFNRLSDWMLCARASRIWGRYCGHDGRHGREGHDAPRQGGFGR